MFLGIGSFTYGWSIGISNQMPRQPMNELDIIKRAVDYKLRCIQLCDNLPIHTFSQSRLENLRLECQKNNIRLEVGARTLTEENLQRYIELTSALNSKFLRFIIDGDDFRPSSMEVVSILRNALPELKSRNIKLGIENHDRLKAKDLAVIIEKCYSDSIGICLDCVNSIGAGEGFHEVAEMLMPFTFNLHFKDFSVKRLPHHMGFIVEGTPAGKGLIDIDWLFAKLASFKRCESTILEQWVSPENTIEETIAKEESWAREGINLLKALPHFNEKKQLNIL